jgi:branched-chain amino acid transport system ATP-binding protein
VKRLLSLRHLSVHYGKAMALDNVSIEVTQGSVIGIIGANGAGKSTILRTVSGLKQLTSGEIVFRDQRINGMGTTEIVKLGIVHILEGRRLFPYLSVLTNLKLGASLRKDKPGINHDMEDILERFPLLRARRNQKAGTLSGGEQQMLAIGRGLMAKPQLLMLDEPSVGLSPLMVDTVAQIVKDINQRGVTVLLVEQNIPLAFSVAKRGYALQVGKVVLEGTIEQLQSAGVVKQTYLGA